MKKNKKYIILICFLLSYLISFSADSTVSSIGDYANFDKYFPFEIKMNDLGGILRDSTLTESVELVKLKPGKTVTVLGMEKYPFFKTKYKNQLGYINLNSFKTNKTLVSIKDELEKIQMDKKRKEIKERNRIGFTKNMIGENAPYFKLKDLNGNNVELSDYKNKLILLEFWEAGCIHCVNLSIELDKRKQFFIDNNIEIVKIESSIENTRDCISRFTEQINTNKETLYGGQQVAKEYGVIPVPALFLIDKNGIIIFSHLGEDIFESPIKEDFLDLISKQ